MPVQWLRLVAAGCSTPPETVLRCSTATELPLPSTTLSSPEKVRQLWLARLPKLKLRSMSNGPLASGAVGSVCAGMPSAVCRAVQATPLTRWSWQVRSRSVALRNTVPAYSAQKRCCCCLAFSSTG